LLTDKLKPGLVASYDIRSGNAEGKQTTTITYPPWRR